jgi:hypothetical protein
VERHGRRAALVAALCALVTALTTGTALAASEVGDTGELPATAQEVGPAGPLSSIDGTIDGTGDRDVYKICLTSGPDFSASTVGNAGFDTELFLLDSGGKAVYMNDDLGAPGDPPKVSRLPAGSTLGPMTPGVYYLAISSFNVDPNGDAGALFGSGSVGVVGPARVGGNRPITGWFGAASSAGGPYRIDLTGAESCIPPDLTAPTVALNSPSDGAQYELGQNVTADYSCTDEPGGSGVASCVGDVPSGQPIDTSSLGPKTFTVVTLDNKGNRREVSVSYSVVDKTDPTVDLRTPPDGAEYARGDSVAADYSCDDAGGSGLATCSGDVADGSPIDTSTLGAKSFSVTATDGAGNTTTSTHSYTVVDRTKPTVDLRTPADGATYERGAAVTADYSCTDEDGGSGLASCTGDVADGQPVDTSALGHESFSVTATDQAGNTITVTHSYTVVDKTAPSISLRTPADRAVYSHGQAVAADYSCADEDGGSGLASCTGDVADGAAIDTNAFGQHSFTVRATDDAGNSSAKTVHYSVGYDFSGFFRLLSRPGVNQVRAGFVVPIVFSLHGDHGRHVLAKGYPRSVPMTCGSKADLDRGEQAGWVGRHRLHYLRDHDAYVFLWDTRSKWEGSCRQFVLKLDDGSYHRLDFRFPDLRHGWH